MTASANVRRWLPGMATVVVVSLITGLMTPSTARGLDDPRLRDTFPVAPGIERQVYDWATPGGPQVINVLRFRLDDERVTLKPELGKGIVPGVEPVHHALSRLGDSAVAAVNGGFWLGRPYGDPEGLVIRDGFYLSEPASQGSRFRAAFALFPGGAYDVGRPGYVGSVWLPSGKLARLSAINRLPADGEVVAYTSAYGPRTGSAPGTVEVLFEGLDLDVRTLRSQPVVRVLGHDSAIPAGATILAGRGAWANELARLQPGDLVTFDVRSGTDWRESLQAVAAGPLILQDGAVTPPSTWVEEGFGDATHNNVAHPRTAVGFTAGGEMLLITVDGRRSRHSVGITAGEAANLLQRMGAVDGLLMDGGGSTTMAVDGRIENRPCCDSAGYRSVANSLVLYSNAPPAGATRLAASGRYGTAARVALDGWPGGAGIALLASGRDFPDGLAGGALAAALDSPLLLTDRDVLPGETLDALSRLGTFRVIILGGTAAVSETVESTLRGRGLQVSRLQGQSRTGTAARIALERGAPTGRAFLASGWGFADALSAAVPAAAARAPLLLTAPDGLPPETADALARLAVREVIVAGGANAVSDGVVNDLRKRGYQVTRVAGADRFTTATELVRWAERHAGFAPTGVALASAGNFPDALAGGPFAAHKGVAVLLTVPHSFRRVAATSRWIDEHAISQAYIFGGRSAVGTWVGHELSAARD